LGGAKIEVGTTLFGTVEADTTAGTWYTITSNVPVTGSFVKVTGVNKEPLSFAEIEVYSGGDKLEGNSALNDGNDHIVALRLVAKTRKWSVHVDGNLEVEGGLANQDAAESEFKFGSLVGNGESPDPPSLPAKVGTGWKLVRHVPPGSRRWHNATDFLSGNDVYGDSFDNGSPWSLKYDTDHFNQFLFITDD